MVGCCGCQMPRRERLFKISCVFDVKGNEGGGDPAREGERGRERRDSGRMRVTYVCVYVCSHNLVIINIFSHQSSERILNRFAILHTTGVIRSKD